MILEDAPVSVVLPNSRRRSSFMMSLDGQGLRRLGRNRGQSSNTLQSQSSTGLQKDAVVPNKKLSPERKNEIIQIFNLFDTDGSGTMGKKYVYYRAHILKNLLLENSQF